MKHRFVLWLLVLALAVSLLPAALAEDTAAPITTAYSDAAPTLDGSLTGDGWQMFAAGSGSLGARWKKDTLYLAVDGEFSDLTVNGKPIEPTQTAVGAVAELSVTMEQLGLTKPPIGAQIPVSMTIGGTAWDGTLELSGLDWFAVENSATILTADARTLPASGQQVTEMQGYEKIDGGYRAYDLYLADGTNPINTRNMIGYNAEVNTLYTQLKKHDYPTHVELDLHVESLPVYDRTKSVQTGSKLYATYGISFVLADEYQDPANSNYWSNIIRTGIVNTADGLEFVAFLDSGKYVYTPLNKQVGDTFRLAMRWEMDGSLTVWVDGEQLTQIAGVETALHWYADECFTVNTIRSGDAAASDADNIDISVTNLAMAKYIDPYTIPTVIAEGLSVTAYAADIDVDGALTESDWMLNNIILDEEGSYTGKFGALWSEDGLYLAVDAGTSEAVTLELDKLPVTVDMSTGTVESALPVTAAASDGKAELFLPIRALDVIEAEPGTVLPIIVRMGEAAFSGELLLLNTDRFLNDVTVVGKANSGVGNIQNSSRDKSGQSATAVTGGITLSDVYVEGVNQYGSGRTYAIWQEKPAYFSPINELTLGTWTEFTFFAEKMPEWTEAKAQTISWTNYASRGFTWVVGDTPVDNVNTYTSLGIYNSADGLKLAIRMADDTQNVLALNKQSGDTFRLGTMTYADGSLDVYVNGEKLTDTPIANVRRSGGTVVKGGIALNLFQIEKTMTSSADDLSVTVTDISMGKEVPMGASEAAISPAIVETAYTAEAPTADGAVTEAGWLMHTNVGSAGKFAAQWDPENLYLAVDTNGAALSVTVNGMAVDLSEAADTEIVELTVPLASVGVTVSDYNTGIPIKVTLGDEVYTGSLKLIGASWVAAENDAHPVIAKTRGTVKTGSDAVTALQGTLQVDGGYRLYDLYDPAGENPAKVRSYVCYRESDDSKWSLLNERDSTTWLSFDFHADAMPEYSASEVMAFTKYNACYGLSIYVTDRYGERNIHNLIALGIHNSPQGLMLAVLRNAGAPLSVPLNRQVGDTVRIGVLWRPDGSLVVYADGEEVLNAADVEINTSAVASCAAMFNLIRSPEAASSEADDFDISITNVAGGKLSTLSLMELLRWDTIRGENETQDNVASDLVLPDMLTDGIVSGSLVWESSDESVITADGKVIIPETLGNAVTLTATLNGKQAKIFELIVPGTGTEAGNVLIVENDRNPAIGVGVPKVTHRFTLDENNNSVVLDLEEKQSVSLVKLCDGDTAARLREDVLTLWVSDDNVTYTRITDFKLLHQGDVWYLYDFSAVGRYVKVHCTHFDGKEADFTGKLETMLEACNDPLLGTGFNESTVSITNNTGKERYDYAFSFDGAAQRVLLDGELLYHYTEDGKTYVRVPYLADGETVKLTVLTGSENALDLSNKEYVYEVSHGVREVWVVEDTHWIQTLPDGTMVGIYTDKSYGYDRKAVSFSYDDGRTWTENTIIEAADDFIGGGGNFIYNRHTGLLIFHGMYQTAYDASDITKSDRKTNMIASEDGGKTWYRLGTVKTDRTLLGGYSPGVELSCYDGQGPNVDFVLPLCSQYANDGTFCSVVAYSIDGGLTWQTSESLIVAPDNTGKSEGGASECTVMEQSDGTLVLYTRYQANKSENFLKSYSYDHGLTWSEPVLSSVYTGNTQPLFYEYNGADLLTWAGNHVLGGNTYIRTPMTVGVSYDNGETFRNLRDLYAGYSMQGLTFTTQNCAINQMVQKAGEDALLLCFWNQTDNRSKEDTVLMRVDEFTDWFYRSKGAYDSFEHGTVKYEGWDAVAGTVTVSDKPDFDGSHAMKLVGGLAARSVPYLQNGTVDLQLYVSDGSHLSVNLQSAYTNVEAKCAPLGFSAENYAITLFGVDAPSSLMLQDGWNTVTFQLGLPNGTAALTVNGETAEMPVNTVIGDYMCFVTVMAGSTVYVDEFCVIDDDDAVIPEVPAEPETFDLYGANMKLSSNLTMNFFVAKANITGEGWYAEIVRGENVTKINLADCETSGDYYKIVYPGFAAKEMTDEVVVTIYDADGNAVSNPWTDSIRAYAMRVFEKENKTLLVDMLNYGAAAQTHFGYNTDDLANALLTDEQKVYGSQSVTLENKQVAGENFYGASLSLKSILTLNLYFVNVTEDMTAVITYTNHNGEAKEFEKAITMNGSYGVVTLTELALADCREPVTCTIVDADGNEIASVTDSIESYCARTLDDQPLNEPLMKFCQSAWNTFH